MFIKAGALEAMVYVCGQHKVVTVAHYVQEPLVERRLYRVVSVARDIAAPKRPILLERVIGIETAGVHVGKAVACGEVAKELFETLARIGVICRGGKTRTRADHHGVRCIECGVELIDLFGEGCGRLPRQTREIH